MTQEEAVALYNEVREHLRKGGSLGDDEYVSSQSVVTYLHMRLKETAAREKLLAEAFKELLNESKAFLSVSSPMEAGRANYGAFNEKVRKGCKALAAYEKGAGNA